MAHEKLLVVGNGMASLRFLEELLAIATDQFAITVVGSEPDPAYNRVLLSPLLAGQLAAVEAIRNHTDFTVKGKNADTIDLSEYGDKLRFKDIDIERDGKHDTVIEIGKHDEILLHDVKPNEISIHDFDF